MASKTNHSVNVVAKATKNVIANKTIPPSQPPGRPSVRNLISQLELAMAHPKTGYKPKKGRKMALFVEYDERSTRRSKPCRGTFLRRVLGAGKSSKHKRKASGPPVMELTVRRMNENEW